MATPRKGKAKVKVTASGKKFPTDRQVKRRMVVVECDRAQRKATHIALVAWESRSDYPNPSRTTRTPPTIYQESAGNALALSRGSDHEVCSAFCFSSQRLFNL